MSNIARPLAVLALLSINACSSDTSSHDDRTKPAPVSEPTPEQPAPTTPEPEIAAKPIPLLVWVDDLIDHHSGDDALPDTVDDKLIEPNEDPSAFDKYLQ